MPIIIRKVAEPYGWMGNMAPYTIVDMRENPTDPFNTIGDGKLWATSEAYFQALRFPKDHDARVQIWRCKSPMAAKMTAKRYASDMIVQPRSEQDIENMRTVLRMKILQHKELVDQLIATGDEKIVEDCSNRRNDSGLFWGAALVDGEWVGRNVLGQCWEELRAEAKKGRAEVAGLLEQLKGE